MAEIADLREKHPLCVVIRDNAKENSSKAICDYFTLMGVKNNYSAGYEPWQDRFAEASIKSTIMLAKCGILLVQRGDKRKGLQECYIQASNQEYPIRPFIW